MAAMRAALAPLTVGRPDPAELAAAAAAAGFERIGITLWLPDGVLLPACVDGGTLRHTASAIAASGVTCLDAGVVVLAPGLDMERLRRFVDAAAALGADRLVAMNRDPSAPRAAATLAAVCEVAGVAGLSVGVEFMPYTATRTVAEARRLVEEAGAPNGGVVLDVLHLYRSGGSASDLAGPSPVPVLLLQLCDGLRDAPPPERLRDEALADRRYPGQGELAVADVLGAVPAAVPVTLEAPVAADAALPLPERAARAAGALAGFLRAAGRSDLLTGPAPG